MKRILGALGVLLGLVLLVAGVATAVVVGSDDTVATEPEKVASDGAPIVVARDVVGYTGVTYTISAATPDGALVGTTHPLDAEDLATNGVTITRAAPGGLTTDAAETLTPGEDPRGWAIWDSVEEGKDVSLDGAFGEAGTDGTQPVIVPTGKTPVEVSLGIVLNGIFVVAIIVALAGLLLIALVIWRSARRRRGRTAATPAARSAQHDTDTVGTTTRAALPVAALALAAAATGCGVPSQIEAGDKPSRPALTTEQLPALEKQLQQRREELLPRISGKPYSSALIYEMATETETQVLSFMSTYAHAHKEKADKHAQYFHADRVWSPTFDSYPMWAVVAGPIDPSKDEKKSNLGFVKKNDAVQVLVKEKSSSPWLVGRVVPLKKGTMPEPAAEPAPVQRPGPEVRRLGAQLVKLWRTGTAPRGVELDAEARLPYKSLVDFGQGTDRRPVLEITPSDSSSAVRTVATESGRLAILQYDLTYTFRGYSGSLTWRDPAYREAYSNRGDDLYRQNLVTVVAHLPDQGRPRVLGTRFDMAVR